MCPSKCCLQGSKGHSTLCLILGEKPMMETQERPILAADGQEHDFDFMSWLMDLRTLKPSELHPFPSQHPASRNSHPFASHLPLNPKMLPCIFKFKLKNGKENQWFALICFRGMLLIPECHWNVWKSYFFPTKSFSLMLLYFSALILMMAENYPRVYTCTTWASTSDTICMWM